MLGQMLLLQMCGRRLLGQICGRPAAADMRPAPRPAEALANMLPAAAAAKNPVSCRSSPGTSSPDAGPRALRFFADSTSLGVSACADRSSFCTGKLRPLIPYVLQCSDALHLH
jgi:hypothetical protein